MFTLFAKFAELFIESGGVFPFLLLDLRLGLVLTDEASLMEPDGFLDFGDGFERLVVGMVEVTLLVVLLRHVISRAQPYRSTCYPILLLRGGEEEFDSGRRRTQEPGDCTATPFFCICKRYWAVS